jgi:hypothetical protein
MPVPTGDKQGWWHWSITGFFVSPEDLGPSAGQEEAMADFASRWRLWLDWAGLREGTPTSGCGYREAAASSVRRLLSGELEGADDVTCLVYHLHGPLPPGTLFACPSGVHRRGYGLLTGLFHSRELRALVVDNLFTITYVEIVQRHCGRSW